MDDLDAIYSHMLFVGARALLARPRLELKTYVSL